MELKELAQVKLYLRFYEPLRSRTRVSYDTIFECTTFFISHGLIFYRQPGPPV